MFRYTTVRRDPDGEFSVITHNGNPYDIGISYGWITNAILHAAFKNRVPSDQLTDPYAIRNDANRRREISNRDATMWAKLDRWNEVQCCNYMVANHSKKYVEGVRMIYVPERNR